MSFQFKWFRIKEYDGVELASRISVANSAGDGSCSYWANVYGVKEGVNNLR